MLDEDQVRGLERDRQAIAELMGADRDPACDHELPQTQILQAQGVDATVLQEAGPDIHLVVDAVGLLLLEIVREHPLRRLLLEIQVRRDTLRDAGDAVLEQPAPMVDGAEPSVEAGAVCRDPVADAGAERAEMIQEALDLGPQEGDDPDLVARVERSFDLGGAGVDPVGELVQGRQEPHLARGLDHRPGQAELGEEIGLDRLPALRRRAADVREAVERVHALEDDRLQLGHRGRGAPLPLEAVEHGSPESPLDGGVNRGALLVDHGLDAAVQLLHAPLDRHGE